jgi:hypothetical protein
VEVLEASNIETIKFPEVVDFVFSLSMVGTSGEVYTLTESRVATAFPVGLETRIYNEYTFPTKGIDAFPVLLITKLYEVIPFVFATPELP